MGHELTHAFDDQGESPMAVPAPVPTTFLSPPLDVGGATGSRGSCFAIHCIMRARALLAPPSIILSPQVAPADTSPRLLCAAFAPSAW